MIGDDRQNSGSSPIRLYVACTPYQRPPSPPRIRERSDESRLLSVATLRTGEISWHLGKKKLRPTNRWIFFTQGITSHSPAPWFTDYCVIKPSLSIFDLSICRSTYPWSIYLPTPGSMCLTLVRLSICLSTSSKSSLSTKGVNYKELLLRCHMSFFHGTDRDKKTIKHEGVKRTTGEDT